MVAGTGKIAVFDLIRSDCNRYRAMNRSPYKSLGFWVCLTYRYGHAIDKIRFALVRIFLLIPYFIIVSIWQFFRCVYIPKGADIGGGLLIFHPQNILIPKHTKIGAHCTLHHDITIGTGPVSGLPVIGNNVAIYPGSKILGGITIGDDAQIGANTVITRNIPSGTAVPFPAIRPVPIIYSDRQKTFF